ncbi:MULTISPECIES: response regulator transcription factor [Clostridium]|uniref:Heme response regulator HssR n=1 Tax=Clostridium frigoriphilum TaxID=443253 RepID=A0ABU7UTS0_9CLOT|nr:response regulator transcription factor [Clostridium sp. DSM 17811]
MAIILIAEDEKNLQVLLDERLKHYYTIILANDGIEAMDILLSRHIDLLIADVMMPKMDGFQLLNGIRQDGMKLPVLILTAKQSFSDKQTGFTFGTDDYMTKPVNFDELHWRIDALLRRANIASQRIIRIGDVTLNEANYTISKNSMTIELPPKEFDLIYKFLSYPGMIFTKAQLLNEIWGYDSESSEDTVKTHVSRLRNKLVEFQEFQIVTIKGLGYKGIIIDN